MTTQRNHCTPPHRSYNVALSEADNNELLTACSECALDPDTNGSIHPVEFIRQCVEATLADRRMARIDATEEIVTA